MFLFCPNIFFVVLFRSILSRFLFTPSSNAFVFHSIVRCASVSFILYLLVCVTQKRKSSLFSSKIFWFTLYYASLTLTCNLIIVNNVGTDHSSLCVEISFDFICIQSIVVKTCKFLILLMRSIFIHCLCYRETKQAAIFFNMNGLFHHVIIINCNLCSDFSI